MAEKEPGTQSTFKKTYSNVSEWVKFLSTFIGLILSAIALWAKIGGASATIDETKAKVEQQSKDIRIIKEHLIQKGIIPPYTGN